MDIRSIIDTAVLNELSSGKAVVSKTVNSDTYSVREVDNRLCSSFRPLLKTKSGNLKIGSQFDRSFHITENLNLMSDGQLSTDDTRVTLGSYVV